MEAFGHLPLRGLGRVAAGRRVPGALHLLGTHGPQEQHTLVARRAGRGHRCEARAGRRADHAHGDGHGACRATRGAAPLPLTPPRGRGTLTLGEGRRALAAGDAAAIPRGAVHWFANGGRAPALAFVVFTPPLDAPDTVPAEAR